MTFETRARSIPPGSGPFIATVVNHLDPLRMGRLEVTVVDGVANSPSNSVETYVAQYLSPFYGATNALYEGTNSADFNDVQKSYGFWAIPPDIGNKVLIIFANSDPNQCFWIGCIQQMYRNHMVPGIAATSSTNMTSAQQTKYATDYLPVAEFNTKTEPMKDPRINDKPKPVHPFADRLLTQGLLLDTIRGTSSSSARREVPSQVYGWSTPGPLDPNGKKARIGATESSIAPVSRLGGSTFVMDDGDENNQNELVRIRTRTGHQILLHNSADLIYIGNSSGSAWIELTSQGKIDVYAEDSVSVHTKGDFNLRADRDFNLEAGRNFNVAATGDFSQSIQGSLNVIATQHLIASSGDYNLTVGGNQNTTISASLLTTALGPINFTAGEAGNFTANEQLNLKSSGLVAVTAGSDVSLSGGSVTLQGGMINMNSVPATVANSATPPNTLHPQGLNLFGVPTKDKTTGWSYGNFYNGSIIPSIMQRIPQHEPWDQHENINPTQFTLANTDSTVGPSVRAENGAIIPAGPSANTPYPAQSGPGIDKGTVRGQKFPWSTDQPFLTAVKTICEGFNFDPLDLLGAMYNESAGTYDPAIIVGGKTYTPGYVNPLGSATGMIQFLESTAKGLGTTTAQLAAMTRPEQMQYVKKFFQQFGWPSSKCPNPNIANIYMTIFLPKFRFAPLDQVIADGTPGSPTQSWYTSNSGFDRAPKKGYITPGMVGAQAELQKTNVVKILKAAGVGIVKGQPDYFTVPASATPGSGTPVKSGSGTIVTDSSGKPVRTAPDATSTTDPYSGLGL